MPALSMTMDDPLEDFSRRDIVLNQMAKRVYIAGSGPAVIVMTEMPGISPHVARFTRWVRDAGFTVYMPSLFGRDGAVPAAEEGVAVFQHACMSAEFRAMAANASSPVTQWLRALARLAHQECGGPGVGAIGMCFTGNFALTMMLEPAMLAPVLSQPSLPLREPAGLEIAPEELAAVRERLEREDLTVLAYRFKGDQICRAERFAAYATALGDRFIGRELPDEAANSDVAPFFARYVPYPHSVVTQHLIDEAGQPTVAARDEILAFFTRRLAPSARAGAARTREGSTMQLANYLFFTTACEAALAFYSECGLGRVSLLMRHGDRGMPVTNEAMRGKVMHAKFEGPGVEFYASDNDDAEPMRGSAHMLTLNDRAETRRLFESLAAGGRITTPLGMQPWGSFYGKLTDRFGVQWMLDCAA